jgi:hypothetical protein
MKVCEACGFPIVDHNDDMRLSEIQRKIYFIASRVGTLGISREALAGEVYASRRVVPDDPMSVIPVNVSHLNRKLRAIGLTVRASNGGDRRYRLRKL